MTEKTEGMTMAQTIRPRPGRNKQYLAGYDAPKEREDIRAAKARMQGQRARYEGESFEKLLDISCEMYRMHGAARIEKTPEPMRPLSRPNSKGQFTACYVKAAQPDYKGTLAGGQAIVFEAKHTEGGIQMNSYIGHRISTNGRHGQLDWTFGRRNDGWKG